jgi:hypothetical protein
MMGRKNLPDLDLNLPVAYANGATGAREAAKLACDLDVLASPNIAGV